MRATPLEERGVSVDESEPLDRGPVDVGLGPEVVGEVWTVGRRRVTVLDSVSVRLGPEVGTPRLRTSHWVCRTHPPDLWPLVQDPSASRPCDLIHTPTTFHSDPFRPSAPTEIFDSPRFLVPRTPYVDPRGSSTPTCNPNHVVTSKPHQEHLSSVTPLRDP